MSSVFGDDDNVDLEAVSSHSSEKSHRQQRPVSKKPTSNAGGMPPPASLPNNGPTRSPEKPAMPAFPAAPTARKPAPQQPHVDRTPRATPPYVAAPTPRTAPSPLPSSVPQAEDRYYGEQEAYSQEVEQRPVAKPPVRRGTGPGVQSFKRPDDSYRSHRHDAEEELRYVDDEDLQEEEEQIRRPRKTKSSSGSKSSKNGRGSKRGKKPNANLAGGRGRTLALRWGVVGGIGILSAMGIYSIVVPPQFPGPDQVVSVVKEDLGVTDFPASNGEGFVLAFTKAYLTYDPEATNNRADTLANYVPDSLLSVVTGSFGSNAQAVSEGPYISGIRYIDDKNAVYTASARLNTGSWVYVEMPVTWDPANRAFAISGAPAFVGKPPVAAVEGVNVEWTEDEEAGENFANWVPGFFTAWAASDEQGLVPLLTPDADPRAKNGLNGTVTYNSMTDLKVSTPLEETDTREARVTITWNIAGTGADDGTSTSYRATYQLLVTYDEKNKKWAIQDIRGGIPTETDTGESAPEEAPTGTEITPPETEETTG